MAKESGRHIGEPYANAEQAICILDRASRLRGRRCAEVGSKMQLVRFVNQRFCRRERCERNGMRLYQPRLGVCHEIDSTTEEPTAAFLRPG
jgi:hypothetical protein